jgi:GTPase
MNLILDDSSSVDVSQTRCGYVAIVGRPSVGKSTLLNAILGKKISITSSKPQTTRHRLLGIRTQDNYQIVYVDTPGIYQLQNNKEKRMLNRYLEKVAVDAMYGVDVIVFVVEGMYWSSDDEWILDKLKKAQCPIILAINKVDRVKDKSRLLPHIDFIKNKLSFQSVLPISAEKHYNLDALEKEIVKFLPKNVFYFPVEQVHERDERFYMAEIVREKLTRFLGAELPHSVTVMIEKFSRDKNIIRISALIFVERPSQKAIVIGKDGEKLKTIGTKARLDMEKFLGSKVFLELWVKVKEDWPDDERSLAEFGYGAS